MSLSGPKHGPPIGLWFLPSVWERVPEPDHWSDDLRVFRYTAESFGAPFRAL